MSKTVGSAMHGGGEVLELADVDLGHQYIILGKHGYHFSVPLGIPRFLQFRLLFGVLADAGWPG